MHSHALELPKTESAFDDMLAQSRRLLRETHLMRVNYHIKSTQSAVRRSEALWESVENARKDKK